MSRVKAHAILLLLTLAPVASPVAAVAAKHTSFR
jgi:hypothetical protein